MIAVCVSSEGEEVVFRDQEKLDLVELLEAVTYLVCQDNHVVPDTFHKVSSSSRTKVYTWHIPWDKSSKMCQNRCTWHTGIP
jgi:hypothetical protein